MALPSPFGLTLTDALSTLERKGFRSSFRTRKDGNLTCLGCGRTDHAGGYAILAFERVEGVSDPSDENIVAGLECPSCGVRGTIVLPYGAVASRRDAAVLSNLRRGQTGGTR